MIDPLSIRLEHAEMALAVANTPEFLERKLRADADVRELYQRAGSESIRRSLSKALKRKPKDMADAVRPYAFLVAMSFDQDKDYLNSAFTLKAKYHDWYGDFTRILSQKSLPTRFVAPKVNAQPVRITIS